MTSDELTTVVEFLTGLDRVDRLITIQENWDRTNPDNPVFLTSVLTGWNIIQLQPTQQQLDIAFASAGFTSYVTNRLVILERNSAKLRLDKEQRFLIKTLIKEFNALRKFTRDLKTQTNLATTLPDFKTRVANLPVLDDRTIDQLKNAYDNES